MQRGHRGRSPGRGGRGLPHHEGEFARRGNEIYVRDVEPALRKEDEGKFVAIDVDSGGYEIDEDDYTATDRLLARFPDAQIWLLRAGEPTTYVIRHRSTAGSPL